MVQDTILGKSFGDFLPGIESGNRAKLKLMNFGLAISAIVGNHIF